MGVPSKRDLALYILGPAIGTGFLVLAMAAGGSPDRILMGGFPALVVGGAIAVLGALAYVADRFHIIF